MSKTLALFTTVFLLSVAPMTNAADHNAAMQMHNKNHKNHTMATPAEMRKRAMQWMPTAYGKVGAKIDPDLTIIDGDGKPRKLGEFFDKPLFVNFIFASCPHACPTLTGNLARAAREAAKKKGTTFHLLTISFDPTTDTPEVMKEYAAGYTPEYADWTFAVAPLKTVKEVNDAFGHSYMPHPEEIWAHMNMVSAVAPGGVITKQIFGLRVPQDEFETALDGLLAK